MLSKSVVVLIFRRIVWSSLNSPRIFWTLSGLETRLQWFWEESRQMKFCFYLDNAVYIIVKRKYVRQSILHLNHFPDKWFQRQRNPRSKAYNHHPETVSKLSISRVSSYSNNRCTKGKQLVGWCLVDSFVNFFTVEKEFW